MPEPIVPALIPQAALAACPACGPCVLVRVWVPLAGWHHLTAPLVPTEGDWHWCLARGEATAPPAPDGLLVPSVFAPATLDDPVPPEAGATPGPEPAAVLPTEDDPLPTEDDPLRRGDLLRTKISEAVQHSGRPVDVYWHQTCTRCRVQTPAQISVPWLEGLLAECEAVLAKQVPAPSLAKRARVAQAARATSTPTAEPSTPAPTPGTPKGALAAGEESWRVTLVTLAIGSLDLLTDTMDAGLNARVQSATSRAQDMAERAETTAEEAHDMCEVLGQLQSEMAGQLGLLL
jgi:hypothetical protein